MQDYIRALLLVKMLPLLPLLLQLLLQLGCSVLWTS